MKKIVNILPLLVFIVSCIGCKTDEKNPDPLGTITGQYKGKIETFMIDQNNQILAILDSDDITLEVTKSPSSFDSVIIKELTNGDDAMKIVGTHIVTASNAIVFEVDQQRIQTKNGLLDFEGFNAYDLDGSKYDGSFFIDKKQLNFSLIGSLETANGKITVQINFNTIKK